MENPKDTNSIFLQVKIAQTHAHPSFCKLNEFKKRQFRFLQPQTIQSKFFSIKTFFPRNGGGPGGPTQAQSACPHFLEKIFLFKRTFIVSFEVVKDEIGVF